MNHGLDVDRRCTGIKLKNNIFCLCAYVLRLSAVCLPAKYIAWAVGECKLTLHSARFLFSDLLVFFLIIPLKYQQGLVSASSPCTHCFYSDFWLLAAGTVSLVQDHLALSCFFFF
jgi:hypothetical protein